MSANIILRLKSAADNPAVAKLIHDSLNAWYKTNRGFDSVVADVQAATIYSRVYDALDPDCCVVAEVADTGALAGSCFFHPRSTHVSLGIMTVSPQCFGMGVSSKLLRYIVDVATSRNQTLRLVSSAMNLDSFSLYNRAGFVPYAMYQDMQIAVPQEGFAVNAPEGCSVREATLNDLPAIVELEKQLQGIDRAKDYKFFIDNAEGIWGVSVLLDADGVIQGVMCSVRDPGCNMVGPGVARTEAQTAALVRYELNRYAGKWSPIVLIPTQTRQLRAEMYLLGARNTETHVGQSLGPIPERSGVALPTFMPETA
ncbi:MAG: GNAT family N-acetyltransferase [Planctomycetia bacterium]|nr:GNAT family N-acetyltransferase [Planctomycetia bacterium]